MSQASINSFFTLRKRPADQHPAKKRKLNSDVKNSPTPTVIFAFFTAIFVAISFCSHSKSEKLFKNAVFNFSDRSQ